MCIRNNREQWSWFSTNCIRFTVLGLPNKCDRSIVWKVWNEVHNECNEAKSVLLWRDHLCCVNSVFERAKYQCTNIHFQWPVRKVNFSRCFIYWNEWRRQFSVSFARYLAKFFKINPQIFEIQLIWINFCIVRSPVDVDGEYETAIIAGSFGISGAFEGIEINFRIFHLNVQIYNTFTCYILFKAFACHTLCSWTKVHV